MFIKIIGFIILLLFAFSSVGEARRQGASRHVAAANKKITKPSVRRKKKAVVPRKRTQRVSRTRKQPRATTARKRQARTSVARKRQLRASRTRTKQSRAKIVRKRQPRIARGRKRRNQQPLPVPQQPPTYLSQLKPHTQRNAQLGGFDRLYDKNHYGQGQTVAVIECSGEWSEMQNVINNNHGNLSLEIRENYKRNFLTSMGDPQGRLHPDEKNDWIRSKNKGPYHGSLVSSVILDLAPQAKVQPVSTYYCPLSRQFYDTADAMIALSQRGDVGVINISSGYIDSTLEEKIEYNADGTLKRMYKIVYTPKLVEAFKTVAKAGKVVVMAAGNTGENIHPPEFMQQGKTKGGKFIGHLLKTLDSETRQSLIISGNLNPSTCALNEHSNKPGNWAEAQERFLCASGYHMLAYRDELVGGTSYAAPNICAALANLCSLPGVTPIRAARALLNTADPGLDPTQYGRGRMNAARALEWLEAGN